MKRSLVSIIGSVVLLFLLTTAGMPFVSNSTADWKSIADSTLPHRQENVIVVTSTADSGPGTLRQALLDAQSGDTITFDSVVFPPTAPVTIALNSGLPELGQGNLTIDASNAGVILNGGIIGTVPEMLLLDDINLTLDGGPNLIINGDFSSGLGHWRLWDERPGATRGISTNDFHSSPNAYKWSTEARYGNSRTVYDTTDTSDQIDGWPFDPGSTVWIHASGGSKLNWRFWYRYSGISAGLHILFPDDDEETRWWWFDRQTNWTEVVINETLPSNAIGVALQFEYYHPERWTHGLHIGSSHNTVQGLQVTNFPGDGIRMEDGAQYNTIGGDRTIGAGPMGQGNLISGNVGDGIYIGDPNSAYNTVGGNYIGLDSTGIFPLGNGGHGLVIWFAAHHNQIISNIISGNSHNGVELLNECVDNVLKDNLIGLNATGASAVGNGDSGIFLSDNSWDNKAPRLTQIIDNVISGNGRDGILIQSGTARNNTVSSNYIGTDVSGMSAVPNGNGGVTIQNGANHNLIGGSAAGASNVIAYNTHHGVGVYGLDTLYNTISRNSIYHNEKKGIDLRDGGNAQLAAPLIFDFDLAAGTVTGATCPNCTVEIFSDSDDEGRIYEAQTIAQPDGFFTLNKGTTFTGPHLTATSTDMDGNTSVFSPATSGTARSLILQKANNLPRIQLQARESWALEDNRIGDMLDGPSIVTEQDADLSVERITNMGLKWVRFSNDFFDSEVATRFGYYSRHYVDPVLDRTISGFARSGIMVMYTLVFWDEEIQAEEGFSRFKTEEEIQRYLDYFQFIVHHFKDRIKYYEILNEPESPYPDQHVEIPDYINLVKRTIPIIRQEYPDARIVVGATRDHEYLFEVLQSDIVPLVDAVSWHVAGGEAPGCKDTYWDDYPAYAQQIKDVASSHGFTGEYIPEELQWRTAENWSPVEPWHWIYSEPVAAKCYARGIIFNLGMNFITGLTPLELDGLHSPNRYIGRVLQNLNNTMAGAEAIGLPTDISTEATNIMSHTFSSSNNEYLIALWTDSIAVDADPGVPATLTIPGFSDHEVIGIDVLHGFQQQLITSEADGDLVIRDLLVKDYPIILRLYEPKYLFLPNILGGAAVSDGEK